MSTQPEIVDIGERIAEHFPVGTGDVELQVVTDQATGRWVRGSEPAAIAVVRVIVWERDPQGGARSVRDIKEQEVHMGWPAFYDDRERVGAFFRALGVVIDEAVAKHPDVVDGWMPSDVMRTDVLALQRASTQAEFEQALRVKSRFGRWL